MLEISEATHIWCDVCKAIQPLIAESLTQDDLNPHPWGDLVCGVCYFVIATLSKVEVDD